MGWHEVRNLGWSTGILAVIGALVALAGLTIGLIGPLALYWNCGFITGMVATTGWIGCVGFTIVGGLRVFRLASGKEFGDVASSCRERAGLGVFGFVW